VKLGNQKELIESTRSIISGDMLAVPIVDLSSRVEVAKEVSACRYEASTCWGQEVFSTLIVKVCYSVLVHVFN
jgi:hypothetical protein